ncbi:hypothetical protein, partial [Actinomadura sp. 7K534]|uniref:hypothetical protein n=1 Tax=Actinomadura sp. 7K534 TaxID=2530366 RepID=UPI001A9D8878
MTTFMAVLFAAAAAFLLPRGPIPAVKRLNDQFRSPKDPLPALHPAGAPRRTQKPPHERSSEKERHTDLITQKTLTPWSRA